MYIEILFIAVVAVTLYGLIFLTEKILARRITRPETDARMIDHDHRSRM